MELDIEIKEQIRAALEADNIPLIRDILDTLESSENPNLVKVEFTQKQMRDLRMVQDTIHAAGIDSVLRQMLDNFMVGWNKSRAKARG